MANQTRVPISSEIDVVVARQKGRDLAKELGFSGTDLTVIATAISELARNIVIHAKHGEVVMGPARQGDRRGILIVASDKGPGIANIALAMQDGYSTAGGLGLGLPGTKRLMDEFKIASKDGRGTKVTVMKWLR